MDQHPIPRQITTFEFKLIGFLTIKQFIYLIVFIPVGFIVYYVFPVPLLNLLLGIITGSIGFALAFLPINDRPMDVWVRNFFKRLTSPTQYSYHKDNQPLYFLKNLYFVSDPHRVLSHIEAREKLSQYLAAKNKPALLNQKKQSINFLFQTITQPSTTNLQPPTSNHQPPTTNHQPLTTNHQTSKKPFFTGVVKNHKLIPIPGIIVYVKDDKGKILRLLKSNPHGIFATFNPLAAGEYQFEIKDPNNNYLFDTMKIKIENQNQKPIEIISKELL